MRGAISRAEPKNFNAWRPALRAGLSRRDEVIHGPSLRKSTVSLKLRER